MKLLALLLCLVAAAAAAAQLGSRKQTVELTSPAGRVRGSLIKSRLDKTIYSFRGIRYAEPPVGRRRFQPPVPVLPWRDVFDATKEGPSCPHPGGDFQSEDCLRLNIYTTKLPSRNSRKAEIVSRPVIVFFHPGGSDSSPGHILALGPEYLMDEDIVLVLVNYRLGPLGFLSTGDSLAPGNVALKDQVESLRWVKKNIASFGGDPNSVTIAGYGAGASSVSLHLVSPMTEGLFHRAILMSGSAINQRPLPTDQKHLAKKLAEILGCPTDTSANMIDCLKRKTAQEITNTLPQFLEWHNDPFVIWSPVVEPEVPNVESYLKAQPINEIGLRNIHQVPLIIGLTKDEFPDAVVAVIEAARKGNTSLVNDLNENWEKIAPIAFMYERDSPRSKNISNTLKQFYFNGQSISADNIHGLGQLYADALTGFSVDRLARRMAYGSRGPVYYYEFTFQGRNSFTKWTETNSPYGVAHHDDLQYLFHIGGFPLVEKNAPENSMIDRLTSMWANFARTGKPIPSNNDKFENITWAPLQWRNRNYLEIGDDLTEKMNLHRERMELWDRLFPIQAPHVLSKYCRLSDGYLMCA